MGAPVSVPQADPTTAVEVWSAIGTWFGGLATVTAVVAALMIAHRDWSRADRERRDEEKAQARLVVSRLLMKAAERFEVVNNSSEPVFDLDVDYVADDRSDGLRGELNPAQPMLGDVLSPGESWPLLVMYLDADGGVVATNEFNHPQGDKVTISFTDSNGRRWRRVNNSPPERVLDVS